MACEAALESIEHTKCLMCMVPQAVFLDVALESYNRACEEALDDASHNIICMHGLNIHS